MAGASRRSKDEVPFPKYEVKTRLAICLIGVASALGNWKLQIPALCLASLGWMDQASVPTRLDVPLGACGYCKVWLLPAAALLAPML